MADVVEITFSNYSNDILVEFTIYLVLPTNKNGCVEHVIQSFLSNIVNSKTLNINNIAKVK